MAAQPSITARLVNGVLNLGKIGEARLDLIPQLSDCNPGMKPTEYNVIIAPARAAEKAGSILKPDDYRESEEMAMQVGRIVAMSPLAFNYDQWKDSEDAKPKVGDIVWFARYAGALIEAAFDAGTHLAYPLFLPLVPHSGCFPDLSFLPMFTHFCLNQFLKSSLTGYPHSIHKFPLIKSIASFLLIFFLRLG